MLMPPFVVIWIWLCAWLNCAGWTLSWLHQLNAGGYAVALALGLAGLLVWHRRTGVPLMPAIHWPKLRRRFRRGFPLAFLILASMAFIGGATHPANNWDTLAYRTPRVLHWLADQQWHWIYSKFPRLNTRTVGFEWLTAPVMLFTGTDRFIFLINVICFLLLPGRIFALFTRLGVRPRAAWHWMWLFPSGYGYVLQAGAVVNDMCGAFMTLTAVEFALRARRAMKISDLWTSGLAAMLMVSVKAFNLVLLLPWLIAVWPALKLSWRRPLATLAVVLLALGASMLPTALANIIYAGDWTAKSIDKVGGGDAKVLLLANALNQPIANLAPPVFPFRIQWENFVQCHTPARLGEEMRANTEGGLAKFQIPDLQTEESAGLGCGLSLLLLFLLAKKFHAREFFTRGLFQLGTLVSLGAWAGVFILMVKVGYSGPARYLLPFYPLLALPVLTGAASAKVFRRRGWRNAAYLIFGVAGLLLVLCPQRPLWPADSLLRQLDAEHSHIFLIHRAFAVYPAYAARADGLAVVRAALPPDASPVGFIGDDQPETSLWRPFGSRQVLNIKPDDSEAFIRSRGIRYAVLLVTDIERNFPPGIDAWCRERHAATLGNFALKNHAGRDAEPWRLVAFQ